MPAGVGLSFADYLIFWALMFGESVILGYRQPKELVNQTVAAIRELGPYEEYKKVAAYLEQEVAYE